MATLYSVENVYIEKTNDVFPLPDSDSCVESYSNSYEINKGSTGTYSDDDSYA